MGTDADVWRKFAAQFHKLAKEESTGEVWRNDRWLRAYGDYSGSEQWDVRSGLPVPPRRDHGAWMLSGGASEGFRARFEALATRAGAKLGPPKGTGTTPLDYWLHRLFLDLRANNSSRLFAASETGGIIERVCEASATFCARLETKALEASAAGGDVWDQIDHGMITLKMADLASGEDKWFKEQQSCLRSKGNRAAVAANLLKLGIEDMERRAEGTWRIFGEAWEAQGKEQTPEFVRTVFQKAIVPAIDGRAGVAAERLRNLAATTRSQAGLAARIMEIQRIAGRLKNHWERKAEIEARELRHKQDKAKGNVTRPKGETRRPEPLVLEHPSKRPSYFQKEAARLLHCSDRQIRNLLGSHKLSRTPTGRIVNDAKLNAEYNARNGPVKY
jgi:hypothetical protein